MSFCKRPGGTRTASTRRRRGGQTAGSFCRFHCFSGEYAPISPVCIVFCCYVVCYEPQDVEIQNFTQKNKGTQLNKKKRRERARQNLENRKTGKWQRETAQGRKKYGKKSALRALAKNARTADDANRPNKPRIGNPIRTRSIKDKSRGRKVAPKSR